MLNYWQLFILRAKLEGRFFVRPLIVRDRRCRIGARLLFSDKELIPKGSEPYGDVDTYMKRYPLICYTINYVKYRKGGE